MGSEMRLPLPAPRSKQKALFLVLFVLLVVMRFVVLFARKGMSLGGLRRGNEQWRADKCRQSQDKNQFFHSCEFI